MWLIDNKKKTVHFKSVVMVSMAATAQKPQNLKYSLALNMPPVLQEPTPCPSTNQVVLPTRLFH
jgi:hypothetical protein